MFGGGSAIAAIAAFAASKRILHPSPAESQRVDCSDEVEIWMLRSFVAFGLGLDGLHPECVS